MSSRIGYPEPFSGKSLLKSLLVSIVILGLSTLVGWVVVITQPPKPKDSCPHYVRVDSLESKHDFTSGDVYTLYTDDGSTHLVDNDHYYAGQKVCVDKL